MLRKVRNFARSLPFLRASAIWVTQFRIRLRRQILDPKSIEAEYIPCPICDNNTDFRAIYRPHVWSKMRVVQCNSCGYRFQRPMPTDDFYNWYYNKRYMGTVNRNEKSDQTNRSSKSYENFHKHGSDIFAFTKPHIAVEGPVSVLEIGAAHGCNLLPFRELSSDVRLFEDEIDRRWEQELQSKGIINWHDRDESVCADVIIISNTLEHIPQPLPLLEQVHDNLTDNGIVYIEVPNIPEDVPYSIRFKLGHTTYFSEKSLRMVMDKTGFEPVSIDAGRHIISIWKKAHRCGA